MSQSIFRIAAISLCALGVSISTAKAADFPGDRPITLVVPFSAGGPTDKVARELALAMGKQLKGQVIVDNSPGAGGTIAAKRVINSKNDGYTLLIHHIGMSTAPALYKNLGFDPMNDYEYVGQVADVPMILVGNKDLPPKNYQELLPYMKANVSKISYANAGVGSASHLCGLLFMSRIQLDLTTVPYKGTAPALTDLIGGQTQVMFATMPTILPYVKSDKLRGLAVTGASRDPSMPDLPSISETLPGFDVKNWIGLFAPAGTPPAIVKKLHDEVSKIMQQSAVQKKLESEGAKYYAMTPEAFGAFQKKESIRWGKIIKSAGIKPE